MRKQNQFERKEAKEILLNGDVCRKREVLRFLEKQWDEKNVEAIGLIVEMSNQVENKEARTIAIELFFRKMESYIAGIIHETYPTYTKRYFGDMMNCGVMALLEQLGNYDPLQSMPTTYFDPYIRHEISNFVGAFLNNTTQHYANQMHFLKEIIDYLEANGISHPTSEHIAKEANLSVKVTNRTLEMIEMSTSISYGDESMIADWTGEPMETPEETVLKKELIEHLYEAINSLPERMRKIVMMKYGIPDEETVKKGKPVKRRSFISISEELGLGYKTVIRNHDKALALMREIYQKNGFI